MEWGLGCWILMGSIVSLGWSLWKVRDKKGKIIGQSKRSLVPKGSSGWPFIGETLDFIASGYTPRPVSFMDKRRSLYGKVFKTHLLGRQVIVSTDAEVNKVILQNQGNKFIPNYPKTITKLLGETCSILQMNGSLHRRVHALIGGFFTSPHLKARITPHIEYSVKQALSSWKHKQPGPIYVQDETKMFTFQVLLKVLISLEPGDEDINFFKREYEEFIKGLICLPIQLPGTQLYKSLKAKERLLNKVRKIVEERKIALDTYSDDQKSMMPNDALDVLLRDTGDPNEVNQRLPLDFITGNIIEMMIPGEDTVPMIMTLAVKFLSDSPVALSRLAEENMELKRQKAESCEDYAWTDYMSLQFTQNVISETLRMANIINAVWRKALNDVEIKGYLIPKGWCVMASFSCVHMDEENYENPYEFNPWRWELKTSCSSRSAAAKKNAFTPFGGGHRLCPGLELSRLEISIFLHHLVTTYGRWVAGEDEIVNFPTVKMKHKLPITIMHANN